MENKDLRWTPAARWSPSVREKKIPPSRTMYETTQCWEFERNYLPKAM